MKSSSCLRFLPRRPNYPAVLVRLLVWGMLIVLSPASRGTRWTLVQFGPNEASTRTPYPAWTEVLEHPTYATQVDPDGDPAHSGIVSVEGIPDGEESYFGVRGTVPILFAVGHKIVATFYNRSDDYIYPAARFSLVDADAPDPLEPGRPWYTLHNLAYEPEGTWVPPHTLFELSYYISDATMVNAIGGPPAAGAHSVVNVSLPYNSPQLVLTKIELSDECDLFAPSVPQGLRAESYSTTAGAGRNLVCLFWEPSTDDPKQATGISRYFIYRDGALYDLVDPVTVKYLGTNLYYIDLNVAPDTVYEYRVSALDRAPYGLYPQGDRRESRFGNESGLSAPVVIRTPPWTSTTLINPWTDLRYLGAIRLPWTPAEEWAYAAEGLTYYPGGNPAHDPAAEWAGSLFAFTYIRSGLAELSIPIPVASEEPATWPTARTLQPGTNLWPLIYAGSSTPAGGTDVKVASLAYHPTANGVSERLYYSVCNFYGTDPAAPSLGWFDLDLTEGHGAWFLGGLPPDNIFPGVISRYLFAVPTEWAATYLGGRSLVAGNTILSGGLENSAGPTLYAFAPWESGVLPPPGAALPATVLLRYAFIAEPAPRVINWRLDETAEGAAWIEAEGRTAIAISYRRTAGDVWYGDSLGNSHCAYDIPEPPFGYKGGTCTEWRNGLLLYNPADLAAVARGEKESWEPQPYLVFDTQHFSRRASTESPESGAITFAPNLQALFYLEHNGDPEMVYGLIHVWRLAPTPAIVLRCRLALPVCEITWTSVDDGRSYQLEQTTALEHPVWSAVGAVHSGDGAEHSEQVEIGSTVSAFFRVVVEP